MIDRKNIIENIINNFQALRNKMHSSYISSSKNCITHSQIFVLHIIEHHQSIGVKEISRKLNITSSATTQLINSLVKNNYVIRIIDEHDRRAINLKLTSFGKKLTTELKNKQLKTMVKFFDALSDQELETLLNLYKKILSKINI